MEGKTQGKSARSLSGRQPENKKPPMKGTPPDGSPKVPDLTMIHADIITLLTHAGVRKSRLQKFKCWGIRYPSRTITVFDIDKSS
jgi:hypothetical protein